MVSWIDVAEVFRDWLVLVLSWLLQLPGEGVVLAEGARRALIEPQPDALGVEHVHGVAGQCGD